MERIVATWGEKSPYRALFADRDMIVKLCKVSKRTAYRVIAMHQCAIIYDPVTNKKHRVVHRHILVVHNWKTGEVRYRVPGRQRGNPRFRDPAYQRQLGKRPKKRNLTV